MTMLAAASSSGSWEKMATAYAGAGRAARPSRSWALRTARWMTVSIVIDAQETRASRQQR
jgi:hypothetical protein